jgi:hypothetical protein
LTLIVLTPGLGNDVLHVGPGVVFVSPELAVHWNSLTAALPSPPTVKVTGALTAGDDGVAVRVSGIAVTVTGVVNVSGTPEAPVTIAVAVKSPGDE